MTKDEAIRLAGSGKRLADMLSITPQAVSKWGAIPELRLYQLRKLKPRWFTKRGA